MFSHLISQTCWILPLDILRGVYFIVVQWYCLHFIMYTGNLWTAVDEHMEVSIMINCEYVYIFCKNCSLSQQQMCRSSIMTVCADLRMYAYFMLYKSYTVSCNWYVSFNLQWLHGLVRILMGECERGSEDVLSSILPCNIFVHSLNIMCSCISYS